MNEEIFQDGFEDFLRESSDDLRMHPSDRVWQGLHARMHPAPKWPYVLGGAGIFALGLATGVWLNLGGPTESGTASISMTAPSARSQATTAHALPIGTHPLLEASHDGIRTLPTAYMLTEVGRMTEIHDNGSYPSTARTETPMPSLTQLFARKGAWSELAKPSLLEASSDRQAPSHAGMASPPKASSATTPGTTTRSSSMEGSAADRFLQSLASIRRRTNLQVYLTPSVSYRNLIGQATRSNYTFANGYSPNAGFGAPTNVKDAVTHRPGIGLEAGATVQYALTRSLRVKTGLQFNLANYDIEAYSYAPELAPLSAARGGGTAIQSLSYFRNATGFSRTWLRNSHFMVSMPVGLEYTVAANRKLSFTVASTLQPTFMLRNRSYLISTNLKNYAEEPSLYRKWNLNAGAEAYLSMNSGSYRWVMGPQIRYQLLSSYKQDYPIQEHLVDFGFKIGVQKTIH